MTKIIQRHDTAANWTAVNPVLAAGEMGVETDTNKFKFGNGTSAWSELAYVTSGGSGGSGTQLTSLDGATEYGELALGDTLAVADGVLNANLDELSNEVNTLTGEVSTLKSSVAEKQEKFETVLPLSIETKTSELITGYTISDSTIVPNNNFSIKARNTACIITTSSSLTYVDMPIKITSKQVCTVPFGNLANQVSNLLFGYYNGEGIFIPVFSFGCSNSKYIQYLALNKTPITTNMNSVSLFSSRMTEQNSNYNISSSIFDKMYFQLYLEGTSLTGFISHKSGSNIYPAVTTFTPTNINDIQLITHARYCHNNSSGPFAKSDFGVYTTGELVTADTMTSPINLSGFRNEFDLSYKALIANPATTTSLGVVQPDGTSITVDDAGVISGQNVKTFSGYSDTGTLVLKSINGVLQWVAEG